MKALLRAALAALPFQALLAPVALAAPVAPAQVFQPGDIYVQAADASSTARIYRVRRSTGATTPLLTLTSASTVNGVGTMAWDPARRGLVFSYKETPQSTPTIGLLAANGSVTHLTAPIGLRYGFSPTRGGRIYCWSSPGQIQYMNPDGSVHALMDASTGQPYVHSPLLGVNVDALTYHPATRSLFTAVLRGTPNACNGGAPAVLVRKLPLGPDGTAVDGPVLCTTFTVNPGAQGTYPLGFTHLPGGRLVLVTAGTLQSSDPSPRLFEFDPQTLAMSTFATPGGYGGVAVTAGGTWSWAEEKIVTLDPWDDLLRSFQQGQTGVGAQRPLHFNASLGVWGIVEVPPPTLVVSGAGLPKQSGYSWPPRPLPLLSGGTDELGDLRLTLAGAGATGSAWLSASAGTDTRLLGPVRLEAVGSTRLEQLLEGALDGSLSGELTVRALVVAAGARQVSNALVVSVE